ncbi:hypothetical protein ACL9RL_18690 [Plantibacter sp. Mn2098]|uniref:hypothetical protein n=1 Tax=Plantibacter sp. Mn2098 TaxID=3395266 RepID=UPI003BD70E94
MTSIFRRKLPLTFWILLLVLSGVQLPALFARWSGSALDVIALVGFLGLIALAIVSVVTGRRHLKRGDDAARHEN